MPRRFKLIINEKLHITELGFNLQQNATNSRPIQHGSTIPSGRMRERDLYVQKRVACPQNAAWDDRESGRKKLV